MDPSSTHAQRDAGREHVPRYPRFFIALRIAQLVLSIVLLGLSGFGISAVAYSGHALMIFTSLATLLTSIYHMVAWFGPAKAYNYWAILGLDIFLLVLWLVSFALVALIAAGLLAAYGTGYAYSIKSKRQYSYDYYDYDLGYSSYSSALSDAYLAWGAIAAAAAAFGAVEFVLYIVSLTLHGIAMTRHRKAGLHCMPSGSTSAAAVLNGNNGEKPIQMQPQAAQAVYPPQQQQQYPPAQYQQGYPAGYAPSSTASPPPQQGVYGAGGPSPLASQGTGGSASYVQGAQVPLDGSVAGQQQAPQYQPQGPGANVYETHGDSRPAGQ